MQFETSLSINNSIKNEILIASTITNKSACSITKKLIRKAININNVIVIKGQLTEYQENFEDSKLDIFRYRLSEEEHFLFSKARQQLNISISKLLLVGFLLFFDRIICKCKKEKKEKMWDNYTVLRQTLYFTIESFLVKITQTQESQIKRE